MSNLTASNLVVSIIVILVIVGLFFIPEIVSLGSTEKEANKTSLSENLESADQQPGEEVLENHFGVDEYPAALVQDDQPIEEESDQVGLFFDTDEPSYDDEEFVSEDDLFGIAQHDDTISEDDISSAELTVSEENLPGNYEEVEQDPGFGYALHSPEAPMLEQAEKSTKPSSIDLDAISERVDQAIPPSDMIAHENEVRPTMEEETEVNEIPEEQVQQANYPVEEAPQSATSRAAEFLRDPFSEARAALRGKDWERTRRARILPNKLGRKSKEPEELVIDGPLTWDLLKSRPIKKVLRKAIREATQVSRLIPEDLSRSRFALQTYIGGVSRVLKGVRDALSADQVPSYLTNLDRNVTSALTSENAERAIRQAWAEVSLSPITDKQLTQQYKESTIPAFDPRLRLTSVEVIQPSNRRGRFNPNGRIYVKFRGFVVGSEVKKVVIYKDGERFRSVRLQRKADKDGRRFFKMAQHRYDRDSVYTVEAIDREDNYFRKNYSFFPRAQRFPWGGVGKASYQIPFPDSDPRIDAFFRVGAAQRSGRKQRNS